MTNRSDSSEAVDSAGAMGCGGAPQWSRFLATTASGSEVSATNCGLFTTSGKPGDIGAGFSVMPCADALKESVNRENKKDKREGEKKNDKWRFGLH